MENLKLSPNVGLGIQRKLGIRKMLSSKLAGDDTRSRFDETQKSHLCGSSWQEEYVKLHDAILNSRRPPRYLFMSDNILHLCKERF